MKLSKFFRGLFAVSLLLGVARVAAAQDVSSAHEKTKPQEDNWNRVNRAARNVKAGDKTAIRTLVNEIFLTHGLEEHFSAGSASIKERLVTAEVDFHNGASDGIDAERVVDSINQLGQRLSLPAFATTDVAEVKKVRVRMLTLYPALIGRGPAAKRDDSRPHFEDKMSPIEAFHVAATLVQQKLFNPAFQLTTQETRQISGQSNVTAKGRAEGRAAFQAAAKGERSRQIMAAIHTAATTISLREMLNQCEQSLDLLGIRR